MGLKGERRNNPDNGVVDLMGMIMNLEVKMVYTSWYRLSHLANIGSLRDVTNV
ncbi:hypothetical protein [Desulfopila aestuarii]|uniref:hypothetical protein n=1 Tax=Desulfopila aestuarii TaxID=231440 RepID=UPI00190E8BBA|nr:hypothetical protein [Desulfopila aestuarii]